MKKTYLGYIWHNPNCPAWNRNPKTNKPYLHLLKLFPKRTYPCTCGYDDDFERLKKFIAKGNRNE